MEKWFDRPDLYPTLQRLIAQRWAGPEMQETLSLLDPALKNFLLGRFSPEELKRRHDAILERAESRDFLSTEELHFHMARGNDPLKSATGWAFFGEDCARKGLWESAFEYYSNAFDYAPDSAVEKKFEYSVARGRCLLQRNLKEARQFFRSLLIDFSDQRHRRPEIFAKIFERLGVIENRLGNLEKARDHFYQGLTCLDPSYEPLEQYLAIRNFLAGLELQEGHVEAAIEEYRDTFETAVVHLPFERRRVLTNNDLGAALLKAGRFEEATQHWEQLAEDLKDREDKNPLVRVCFQMGQAYQARGDFDSARRYLEAAEEKAKDLQNFEISLRIYNSLANLYRGRDEEKALVMYEKALDSAFHTGDAFSTAVVLLNMGFLLEAAAQFPRAKQCLIQGLNFLRESGGDEKRYRGFFQTASLSLARASAELYQPRESLAFARDAKALLDEKTAPKEDRFETALAVWQAQVLNAEDAGAKRSLAALEKMAKAPAQKTQLAAVQKRTETIQRQLTKIGSKSPSKSGSGISRSRSKPLQTQSTHILALQSSSLELDSSG